MTSFSRVVAAGLFLVFLCLRANGADEAFSWRQCSGQTLRVMLSVHPYAEGIKRKIEEFEELTGIDVAYITIPENNYFKQLHEAFAKPSVSPDVFMTGAYQIWELAPQKHILPLDEFLENPALTRQGYNVADFFPAIIDSFRWNGRAGSHLGRGPLWAIPLGFEVCALTYNRELFARARLPAPHTMEELIAAGRAFKGIEGGESYGVAARGVGQWNSLHSGYITAYINYGGRDMAVEDGKLVSKVNSPEAVAVTDLWVRMLQECGPEDWEFYDWYRCLDDIGNRNAAMLIDSDILGFFANSPGASSQSGKLAMVPPPTPEGVPPSEAKSNLWVWGLGINPDSATRDAAWLFVQFFTSADFQSYSVFEWKSLNPPRRSVFEDPQFHNVIKTMYGFEETFKTLVENTRVYFTPNPYIFDIADRWAAVIRDIANGMYESTQDGMDTLKIWMDSKLSGVEVE